jgi:hypothetical protein
MVQGEPLPGSGPGAEPSTADLGLAVLVTDDSLRAERELMLLDVKCGNHAPAFVRAALSDVEEIAAVRDDVMLVASELVTNAVMHSGGGARDTVRVQAVPSRRDVVISVVDPGLSDDAPRCKSKTGCGWAGMGFGSWISSLVSGGLSAAVDVESGRRWQLAAHAE